MNTSIQIEPQSRWKLLDFKEIWKYRDLLWLLAKRDISLRYKQTAIGSVWAILQPLLPAIIFAVIFGKFARLPSDGSPYMVFVFCGMVIWTFFSQAITRAGNSLIGNSQLITKIYFPRIIVPLSSVGSVIFDLLVSCIVLAVMLALHKIVPTWRVTVFPLFLLEAFFTSVGISLWLSALNVKYRDFMYAMPFIIQLWLYATPIVYSSAIIPEKYRWLYALNPAVGFVEGVRWSLLGKAELTIAMTVSSLVACLVFFLTGLWYFKRMEDYFADVI